MSFETELRDDLRQAGDEITPTPTRPQEVARRGRRRRRMRHAATALGGALAVLTVALVANSLVTVPKQVDIVDQPSPTPTTERDQGPGGGTVAPEIAEHASGGQAATHGFGSVWIAGPYQPGQRRSDATDIVRASPDGQRLEALIEVPVPLTHLAVTEDALWAVRVGDGGVPQNLLFRIDPTTNQVTHQIDLGEFSTAGMTATSDGNLLLIQGNGHPGVALWLSSQNGEEIRRQPLEMVRNAGAIAFHDGVVAVADKGATAEDSRVLKIHEQVLAAEDGTLTDGPVQVSGFPTDLAFASDGLWVVSFASQQLSMFSLIAPSATRPDPTFELPDPPVAVLADPASPGAFVVTQDGTVYFASADRDELSVVAELKMDTRAAVWTGHYLWLVGDDPNASDGVAVVAVGQQTDDRASDPTPSESEPPSAPLLEGLGAPRLVVEHAGGVWSQLDGGPWRLLGGAQDVRVVGEGRWWYAWSDPNPVLRSVADPDITCAAPDGFFNVERRTAVIHEDGLTSVFVASEDGTVSSVVCEDPERPSPIEGWRPPTQQGEAGFGPFVHVDDGITLVSYSDAEGNLTVYDKTGEQQLIDRAISGPMVDADRGLLVYVAEQGGMHFAGGTLVVTDLNGDELHRVDLGGTSHLSGLFEGLAVIERVHMPEFIPTHHVVVDVTTGTVVDEAAATVGVRYIGH